MIIMEPGYTVLRPQKMDEESRNAILTAIEAAGRVCYKSEGLITDGSASNFVRKMMNRHHYAMLEHASMTVKWTVDIAVGREMVRHRIASYAQESTRYCNYSKDQFGSQITVIRPYLFEQGTEDYDTWKKGCEAAQKAYFGLLNNNKPEWARSVLPLCTKAQLVSTMNMREWLHFFMLRAADVTGPAHPQMKQVTVPLLMELQKFLPEIFDACRLDDAKVQCHG